MIIGGALFSHVVMFPIAWRFFASFETDCIEFVPRVALVFQMPTLALFLAKVGVISARALFRHAKHAVLGVFIVSAIVTPPDPASQLVMVGPMTALYGACIAIAWVFGKRARDD